LWPKIVFAQNEFSSADLSNLAVYSTRNIFDIIVGIVNIILGFLGTITVLLFLYAGYLWLTSRGSADRIDQAKKIMLNATIGVGIIFVSYALVNFVFRSAYNGIFGGGGGGGGPVYPYTPGAVLGGVLESHYPARNASNVARNTNITVTFREPINLAEILLVDTCDPVATDCVVDRNNIMVYEAGNISSNLAEGQLRVRSTANYQHFTFNPASDLGNDNYPVIYTVQLNNLRTGNGLPALINGTYNWSFAVGTWVDNVAPTVTSVVPVNGTTVARNSIVQINFSESMDPALIPVDQDGNDYIRLTVAGTEIVGNFYISNQYQTVEFITDQLCGQNSCGVNVYCLPATVIVDALVSRFLTDMAGNQMTSDYIWLFNTNNEVDLTGPEMTNRDTGSAWHVNEEIHLVYDSSLSGTSVNHSTVSLAPTAGGWINHWTTLRTTNVANDTITIWHDPMIGNTEYTVSCTSGITDLQQNCYYPCNLP